MEIPVKKLSPKAILPLYASSGAAGADLHARLDAPVTINPGETALIGTGLSLAIPPGYGGFVFARSGLATKSGLAPANKVGVIDSDYRGEIKVPLHNHSPWPKTVSDGERIAQLAVIPVAMASFIEMGCLDETERGEGGFGSTGR